MRVEGTVRVSVPATSANLGPGFDTFGIALDVRDDIVVTATEGEAGTWSTVCAVDGEGAGQVPVGDDNLVAATIRKELAELVPGLVQPTLHLACTNRIPHGRGLGSSAAAIVAGLAAAWDLALLAGALAGRETERTEWLVDRSSALEGHGDNSSAAVLGGAVVSWRDGGRYRALPLPVDPGIELVTAVPAAVLPTSKARAMLPASVPIGDAVFTGARTALLVEALRGRRDLLLAATEDRLHQDAREAAMPSTLGLVRRLRAAGHAATVSGAGPSVLVFGATGADVHDAVRAHGEDGWTVRRHELGTGVSEAPAAG